MFVLLTTLALSLAHAQSMGPWLNEALPAPMDSAEQRLGTCPKSHLSNGVQLPAAPDLYKRWHPDKAWARAEMVEAITRVSEEMAWLMPEADPIVIGDISTRYGGVLEGHKSHRAGVDADVGLYWGNGRMHKGGFRDVSASELDLEANWLLIRSLLDTGLVERILLDQRLINALRAYTIASGELTEDEAERIFPLGYTRMWTHTGVVHHAPNHKEHLHLRVLCWED